MNRFAVSIAILIPLATVFYVTLTSDSKEPKEEEHKPTPAESEIDERKEYSVEITSENFKSLVLESDVPVVLDFWAPWCGPCMMIGPHLEEVAKEYDGVAVVGKVNTDEQKRIARGFRVDPIPHILVLKRGKVIKEYIGYRADIADQLRATIDSALKR